MTSCERAQSLYGPAWDDELSVAEREGLELHFTACASCRRDYDEFARTLELVQGLPRPQVSGDFATRVLAEARRREAEGGLRRVGLFAGGIFARPGALAIAAALIVAVGVSGLLFLRPAPGPLKASAPTVAQAPSVLPRTATAGDPDVPISTGPVASAPRSTTPGVLATATPHAGATRTRAATPASGDAMAAIPDSLFDHSEDVELVLDPVKLRRERGRGYTPVPTSVRGEQASITF